MSTVIIFYILHYSNALDTNSHTDVWWELNQESLFGKYIISIMPSCSNINLQDELVCYILHKTAIHLQKIK